MENVLGMPPARSSRVDFFTSHEGLHLAYEEAQTRQAPAPRRAGTTSRLTSRGSGCARRRSDGAHVEYFRGIANPIGVKVGPAMSRRAARLLDVLHPENEPGASR